ncbi:MAG: hypothetical protein HC880_03115 [Bacteroidia bacterium]|nr:hypothetical protein [Bacteroidia bacterium]
MSKLISSSQKRAATQKFLDLWDDYECLYELFSFGVVRFLQNRNYEFKPYNCEGGGIGFVFRQVGDSDWVDCDFDFIICHAFTYI